MSANIVTARAFKFRSSNRTRTWTGPHNASVSETHRSGTYGSAVRVWWTFVVVAVLTLLTGVLLSGDGAGSGEIVYSFGGDHGVNRNDLPVLALSTVGFLSTALLLLGPGPRTRQPAAAVAAAAVTVLLVILLLGLGPGAEDIRLSVARRHGLNAHGLALTSAWAVAAYAIARLARTSEGDRISAPSEEDAAGDRRPG